MNELQQHWETIYATKTPDQMSWTEACPEASLALIEGLRLPKTARILDVGGGNSPLADFLLKQGYPNVTVLDISATALEKSRQRMGPHADRVQWLAGDVLDFDPPATFDLWHDRAAFHFMTTPEQVARYKAVLHKALTPDGHAVLATFSTQGPPKCSGLPVTRYDADTLAATLGPAFELIRSFTTDHHTPFGTLQNFLFCSFRRSQTA